MRLDVIIPTFNRQEMLARTLDSLFAAVVPRGLEVRIIVVDNNSTDGTKELILSRAKENEARLSYVFEPRQGRSSALNAGIAADDGDLIGMIDDDEEIDEHWYECVYATFSEREIDFIGGPYIPRWGAQAPDWLPRDYLGVIGWVEGGEKVVAYDEKYPGILMGGNAVLTRDVIKRVGSYNTSLSRTGTRLLAGEDEDMYKRLLDAGARGLYIPDLIIYHYVPPERLTKRYFRRWCFWRGVSLGLLERESRSGVARLAGIPRWLYGAAARGAARRAKSVLTTSCNPDESFAGELALWDLAGFAYGKHFYKPMRS
jgi:glucosyl-dolichyl phosphate glucuronosyltransferase